MNPEFIISIIVKARNEISAVLQKAASDVDSLTKSQDRQTTSQKKQADATKSTAAAMDDATKRFAAYTDEVERGTKSGDEAEKQLRSFANEFDSLGRSAKAGTDVSDSFFQMGTAARSMANDIKAADAQVTQSAKDAQTARTASARNFLADVQSEIAADAKRSAAFDKNLQSGESAYRSKILTIQQGRDAYAAEQAAEQANTASMLKDADAQLAKMVQLTKQIREVKAARTDVERAAAGAKVTSTAQSLRGGGTNNNDIRKVVDDAMGRQDGAAISDTEKSIHDLAGTLREVDAAAPKQGFLSRIFGSVDQEALDRVNKGLSDFQNAANRSSFSAVRLAGNIRGIVIISALTFLPQLVSALISVGGALVSVASAAIQAGAAVGGAFTAGVAQAIPVVGLLAAAWQQVGGVLTALKQAQTANQKSTADGTTAANQQASAADSLVSAQEAVANAQQQVTVAQTALTQARKDAVRQIQDLVTAEQEAQLQAEQSALAYSDAKAAFATAVRGGDVGSLASDALQVQSTRLQASMSVRDASRAKTDANVAVGLGVSGQPNVVDAQRSLASATQGVADAQRQLEEARRSAVTATNDVGSAQQTLDELLAKLSPAQKKLYDALSQLEQKYKQVFTGPGGVLESMIGAFTDGVKRVSGLLSNSTLVGDARKLADSISTQMKGAFKFLTGPKQVGFVEEMSDDARKNLPILTQLLEHVATLLENIAKAGAPALHAFLGFFDDLTDKADKATGSDSGLSKLQAFFSQGEKFAQSFIKLGLAIGGLFLAIIGTSAKQGQGAIQSITNSINQATDWIDSHRAQVQAFFSQAIKSAGDIMSVVGTVAKVLFGMFNPGQIKSFADALNNTVLPALASIFKILGTVSGILSTILGSKVGKDLVEFGLAFFAFSKILKLVVAPLLAIVGGLALLTGAEGGLLVFAKGLAAIAFGPEGLAIAAVAAAVMLLNDKFHFLGPTIAFIKTVSEDVFDWLSVHWPLLLAILGGPFGLVTALIIKNWGTIKKVVSDAVGAIVGLFVGFGKSVVDKITQIGTELKAVVPAPFRKIGQLMIDGLLLPFKLGIAFFKNIGTWLFNNIIKPIYDYFEISSPSKLFARIGGFLIQGLINGLEDGVTAIGKALLSVGEAIVTGIVKGIESAPNALINAITGLLPGPIRGVASKALGLANDVLNPVAGAKAVAGVASGLFHDVFGGGGSSKPKAATPAKTTAAPDPTRVIAQALSSVPDDSSNQAAFVKQWTSFWQKLIAIVTAGKTAVNAQFWDINWYASDQINKLYENARNTLIDLQTAFEYRSQSIVDIWDSAWQDIQTITFKGLTYVATETNAALKSLGAKVIDFGLTAPQFATSDTAVQTHAAGGPVVGPGSGTSDSIPARLSNGEHVWTAKEVANAGGHGAVAAMRRMFGGGGQGGPGFASGGAVVDDHTGDLTEGQEPELLTAVKGLANFLHTTIEIISAYRTPAHSIAVGGFADDPHTKGEAMDIGVPGGFLYSKTADSVLAKFGLYRPFYPASAKEYDHVQLLAGAAAGIKGSAIGGATASAASATVDALKKLVAPHVDGTGPMSKLAQSILDKAYKQAKKQVSTAQGGASGDLSGFSNGGGSNSANQTLAHKMMLAFGWPESEWGGGLLPLWTHESGFSTTAGSPDAAYGIPQSDPGSKMASIAPDWLTNAVTQIKWGFQYIKGRYQKPSTAWAGWYGGNFAGTPYAGSDGYAGGGAVNGPGSARSDSITARLSNGEHVWSAAEVVRAGGHKAMYALRSMLGGGGQSRTRGFAGGGAVYTEPTTAGATVSSAFTQLAAATLDATLDARTKSVNTLISTLTKINTDGGVLDQLDAAIQALSDKLTANVEAITYRITKAGTVVQKLTAAQVADKTVDALQTVYANLLAEQTNIQKNLEQNAKDLGQGGLTTAQKNSLTAQQISLKKRLAAVKSSIADNVASTYQSEQDAINANVDAINNKATAASSVISIQQRLRAIVGGTALSAQGAPSNQDLGQQQAAILDAQAAALKKQMKAASKSGNTDLASQLAQQISDLQTSAVEAVATGISADVDEVNRQAARATAAISVQQRIATALGNTGQLAALDLATAAADQTQIAALQAKQNAANAAGDSSLAESIGDQISDLSASVQEASAQAITDAVTNVSNLASRQSAAVGLTNRLADLQEKAGNTATAYAMRGSALQTTGADLTQQRDSLSGLLATATSEGNTGDIASLSDSIADLNVQIQENSEAIEENTTAARQASIDAITNRDSFLGGVYGGIQTLVTTLGAISGTTNTSQLVGLLGQAGTTLGQTGSDLLASLKSDYGIDLTGQSPTQLSSSLSGLNYDSIESGMPVDDKATFEGLINAIISNTNSQVTNTQQLMALTQATTQTFTSTAWQWFRNAIFDGSGGLLPQYQNAALGITSTMPVGAATSSTTALAASNASSNSTGGVFAPQITNVEQTVDMDAETLSNRLYFSYVNKPKG